MCAGRPRPCRPPCAWSPWSSCTRRVVGCAEQGPSCLWPTPSSRRALRHLASCRAASIRRPRARHDLDPPERAVESPVRGGRTSSGTSWSVSHSAECTGNASPQPGLLTRGPPSRGLERPRVRRDLGAPARASSAPPPRGCPAATSAWAPGGHSRSVRTATPGKSEHTQDGPRTWSAWRHPRACRGPQPAVATPRHHGLHVHVRRRVRQAFDYYSTRRPALVRPCTTPSTGRLRAGARRDPVRPDPRSCSP